MGPGSTGLYRWDTRRRTSRLRDRRLAAERAEQHRGLVARFADWLNRVDSEPTSALPQMAQRGGAQSV